MDIGSIRIELKTVGSAEEREAALLSIIEYLLKRYCEVLEHEKSDSLPESIH